MAGFKWSRPMPVPVRTFGRPRGYGVQRTQPTPTRTFQKPRYPMQRAQRAQPTQPAQSALTQARAHSIFPLPDAPWTENLQQRIADTSARMIHYLRSLRYSLPDRGRPLRLVYLSCHGPLEHDELTLFGELGCEWVCLQNTDMGPVTRPRQTVRKSGYPVGCNLTLQNHFGAGNPMNVPADLLAWADVLVVMYEREWIKANVSKLSNKPIIWRAIGQGVPENDMSSIRKRIFCVRMSPRETSIAGYMGTDTTIRFYKDPNEFSGWRGDSNSVLAVMGMPNMRRTSSRIDVLETVLNQVPNAELFGLYTEKDIPSVGRGTIGYEALKEKMRSARAFFTIGSLPGPYTMALIEAMMIGCPIVTIGHGLWSGLGPSYAPLYETPAILGDSAAISDDIGTLVNSINRLVSDHDYARSISAKVRDRALQHFSKATAAALWGSVFSTIRTH